MFFIYALFSYRQDWSHAFYMGKLSEKLGLSHDKALSYYAKAIALNPSAVDSIYRMHASRLKFLGKCGKGDLQAWKVYTIKSYKFSFVACFKFSYYIIFCY